MLNHFYVSHVLAYINSCVNPILYDLFSESWQSCVLQVILVLKSVDMYEITNTSVMVQIVSHVLAYMNSCVNPILYAFLSENFRKAFRKVIYCGPDRSHLPGHINGRPDQEKSALTKTTRTNDILWGDYFILYSISKIHYVLLKAIHNNKFKADSSVLSTFKPWVVIYRDTFISVNYSLGTTKGKLACQVEGLQTPGKCP